MAPDPEPQHTPAERTVSQTQSLPPLPQAVLDRYSKGVIELPPVPQSVCIDGKTLPVITASTSDAIRTELTEKSALNPRDFTSFADNPLNISSFTSLSNETQDKVLQFVAAVTRELKDRPICTGASAPPFEDLISNASTWLRKFETDSSKNFPGSKIDSETILETARQYLMKQNERESIVIVPFLYALTQAFASDSALVRETPLTKPAHALIRSVIQSGIEPQNGFLNVLNKIASQLDTQISSGEITAEQASSRLESQGERILTVLKRWERIQPELGENMMLAVSRLSQGRESELLSKIGLIEQYALGLLYQGETEIADVLNSVDYFGTQLNEQSVRDALVIHAFTGFLRISRLSYVDGGNKESPEAFQNRLHQIAESLTSESKPDQPTIQFNFAGVTDIIGDVLSGSMGKTIQEFLDQGYRVVPYEQHAASQIPTATERTVAITGRKPDLVLIAGHGPVDETGEADGTGITLGVPNAFEMKRAKLSYQAISEELSGAATFESHRKLMVEINTLLEKPKLAPWETRSVQSGRGLTAGDAYLDVTDAEIFTQIGRQMSPDGKLILFACGPMRSSYNVQLCEVAANASGKNVISAEGSFYSANTTFTNRTFSAMSFLTINGEPIQARTCSPKTEPQQ